MNELLERLLIFNEDKVKLNKRTMDPECIPLCKVLNEIDGVRTVHSCRGGEGHCPGGYVINAYIKSMDIVRTIRKYLGKYGWEIVSLSFVDETGYSLYSIHGGEGPEVSDDSYRIADEIKRNIKDGVLGNA